MTVGIVKIYTFNRLKKDSYDTVATITDIEVRTYEDDDMTRESHIVYIKQAV